MEGKIVQAEKPADELSVKEIILNIQKFNSYLIRKWKVIFLFGALGAITGFTYAYLKKPTYTAECTFVLQDGSNQGSVGQYSALASMVGIDVGSGNGLFEGDNIIELYKSRLMLEKTLLTPVNINGTNQLLIDKYIEFNKLREAWNGNPKLKYIKFNLPKENFTLQHDSIITRVVNDLEKNYLVVDKPDKKLSIISVKTNAKDELFAKAFTQSLVANVNDFYIQTKTKGVLQNLKLLQHQSDSIRRALNSSISGSASALDANPNPNPALQVLRVPSQRRQIDVQANSAIYTEVVKNLEVARGMLQRETPLIQIIDQPVLPLANDKTGKLKALLSGGILGAIIGIFLIAVRKAYKKLTV
jgi:uncharacterized protein involved in exopolysaccharide biosynthesis